MAKPFTPIEGIDPNEQYMVFMTVVRMDRNGESVERLGYTNMNPQLILMPMADGLISIDGMVFDFDSGLTYPYGQVERILLDSSKAPIGDPNFPSLPKE